MACALQTVPALSTSNPKLGIPPRLKVNHQLPRISLCFVMLERSEESIGWITPWGDDHPWILRQPSE
jgi:hypothetical protein